MNIVLIVCSVVMLSITVIISVWGHSEIYVHWWGVPWHIKKRGLWNGNKTKNGDLRSGHNPKEGEVLPELAVKTLIQHKCSGTNLHRTLVQNNGVAS